MNLQDDRLSMRSLCVVIHVAGLFEPGNAAEPTPLSKSIGQRHVFRNVSISGLKTPVSVARPTVDKQDEIVTILMTVSAKSSDTNS
jgi:hypothetical protein